MVSAICGCLHMLSVLVARFCLDLVRAMDLVWIWVLGFGFSGFRGLGLWVCGFALLCVDLVVVGCLVACVCIARFSVLILF